MTTTNSDARFLQINDRSKTTATRDRARWTLAEIDQVREAHRRGRLSRENQDVALSTCAEFGRTYAALMSMVRRSRALPREQWLDGSVSIPSVGGTKHVLEPVQPARPRWAETEDDPIAQWLVV